MKKTCLTLLVIALLVASTVTTLYAIESVEANPDAVPSRTLGSIYIELDGRVTPSSVPIQKDGNVYTFTENITCSAIWVLRNDIIIDGAGYTLKANQSNYYGLVLNSTRNVTVKNLQIIGFHIGLNIQRPAWAPYNWYDTVQKNPPPQNPYIQPSNNTVTNCRIFNNKDEGILLEDAVNNKILKNIIIDNGIGVKINLNPESVVLGNEISENELKNNGCGIYIENYGHCMISGNEITRNSGYGIELHFTSDSILSQNTITHNGFGILVDGPEFASAKNNVICDNLVAENIGWGIRLTGAQQGNNHIYQNNFIDNNMQEGGFPVSIPLYMGANSTGPGSIIGLGRANFWNNSLKGNYWSNFQARYPNATAIINTGTWNTPFFINENNIDQQPLVQPIINPQLPPTDEMMQQTDQSAISSTELVYLVILSITAVLLVLGSAVYFKKRKR